MVSHLELCIVRIHSSDGIVGAGFLVDDEHVITCAHVVASALGCPADEIVNKKVNLDFPLVEGVPKTSVVVQFSSYVEGQSETDIAGLKLCKGEALPSEATPARLVKLRSHRGRVVDLFGCPPDHPKGDWILDAVLSNPVHSSRVQLEIRGNLTNPVRPGFSGGPVWDKNEQAIVGMTVEANEKYGTGEMISVTVLAETWEVVRKVATVPIARLSNVPPLPSRFVPRPEYMKPLKAELLGESDKAVAVTATGSKKIGVQGMGGIGKTVLAAAAAQDEQVRCAYPDGIIWLTLGQQPNLIARQIQLAKVLGEQRPAFDDAQEGKAKLEELLADKACLVVLDDVWKDEHAEAFDVLGGECRMLITTRQKDVVAALEALELQLDVLEEKQALVLLSKWAGTDVRNLPAEAHEIVQECDGLPLALAMVGAMIQRRPERWDSALQRLKDADLEKFKREFPGYPYPNLFRAMAVSVDALEDEDKERYLDFAIFPEDTPIPEETLQMLWQADGISRYDVQDLLDLLEDRSMLRRDEAGRLTLHDLQLDYVRKEVGDGVPARHRRLLDAYQVQCLDGWHAGPDDGYFFQYLCYHLSQGEQTYELTDLLLDYRWLQAKLDAAGTNALLTDYEQLGDDSSLRLVQSAIRMSTHVLAEDQSQLAGQLTGRLLLQEDEKVGTLLAHAANCRADPWLRPLSRSLLPAGGALLQTLTGHDVEVNSVAVTPDGRCAVSASWDKTLRIWNLQTGACLRILTGHRDGVISVAVTPDGSRAVSASQDDTLRIWNLLSGACLRTLTGHDKSVKSVAVTPDGECAVSGSNDKTLRIWNLQSGACLRILTGHRDGVICVAVTPDGRCAVSASFDRTLRIWNLQTGACLRTLIGHDDVVRSVAVTPDGRCAVSASHDKTLRVWDLQTGACLRTLTGHDAQVSSVAVTPDGRCAVSASHDKTLRVWDLQTSVCLETLTGQNGEVHSVAVTPDGRSAVSASWDNTVRIWDLQNGGGLRALTGHDRSVNSVAVTPDGRCAVSGSWDSTLRIWDIQTGVCLRTLVGHDDGVSCVAITPDGSYAISASNDKMLRIWNLQSGACLRTLTGHDSEVNSVAVTPNGRCAVSASWDKTLRIWDLQSGAHLQTLTGHEDGVITVEVTPDGRCAVSASWDKTLRIWNLQTGACLRKLTGHKGRVNSVAVTPDGRCAVSASEDKTLRIWDLPTGACLRTLIGHDNAVRSVAGTPDGRCAVSASFDRTLRIWDLQTGTCLRMLTGHDREVDSVAVTPDGRCAASASGDKTLRIWDLQSRQLIAAFYADSALCTCVGAPDSKTIIAGDYSGTVHFLRLENVR